MFQNITLKSYGLYLLGGVAAIGVVIGIVFGCAAFVHEVTKERPHFNSGKVIERNYEPAHNEPRSRQVYDGEDCTSSYDSYTKTYKESCWPRYRTEWYMVFVPDYWSIKIENCNVFHKDGTQWVDKKTNTPKCFTKWLSVDGIAFNSPTTKLGVVYGTELGANQ